MELVVVEKAIPGGQSAGGRLALNQTAAIHAGENLFRRRLDTDDGTLLSEIKRTVHVLEGSEISQSEYAVEFTVVAESVG